MLPTKYFRNPRINISNINHYFYPFFTTIEICMTDKINGLFIDTVSFNAEDNGGTVRLETEAGNTIHIPVEEWWEVEEGLDRVNKKTFESANFIEPLDPNNIDDISTGQEIWSEKRELWQQAKREMRD